MTVISVRLVRKCRTAEQRVFNCYETGVHGALATQSVFHDLEPITQEGELGFFVFSARQYLFYNKRDVQFEVHRTRSDGFSPDFQLKNFFAKSNACSRGDLVEHANLKTEKSLHNACRELCQFMMRHLQGMLMNSLLYCLPNMLAREWSFLGLCLVPHPGPRTLSFLFAYLLDVVLSVLGITKPALLTASIAVLDDDGNPLSGDG